MTSYYDVIVLGTDLSSLVCAALAAKRGFRVLVVGQGDVPEEYTALGWTLPREPFLFTSMHSPLTRRIFSELALLQLLKRQTFVAEPSLQIATPRLRFEICANAVDTEREVEREFPEVKRPIDDFYRNVLQMWESTNALFEHDLPWPPETFFERREFVRFSQHLPFDKQGNSLPFLREFGDEHPFRTTVRAPLHFAVGMNAEDVPTFGACRLLAPWLLGPPSIQRGKAWLQQQLIGRILGYSGSVLLHEKVDKLLVKRNAVVGARMTGSGEEVGCTTVVAGCELPTLLRTLPDRAPFETMFERFGEPHVKYYRYALNIAVDSQGVPEGLAKNVFFIRDPRAPLSGTNAIHIEVLPGADPHQRVLCIGCLLPRQSVEQNPNFLGSLREQLVGVLGEVAPFIENHFLMVDSPHDGRDIYDFRTKEWVRPSEPWNRGPNTMPTISSYPVLGTLGVCVLPIRTPIRHLLLAGTHVAPTLGQEGQVLSGYAAARILSSTDKRRKWMRRSVWSTPRPL